MVNLKVNDARERASSIDVTRYDIELDLDLGDETFGSTCRVTFQSRDGKATFIEVAPVELHSIELNGELLDAALLSESRYPLDPATGTNVLTVRATMGYSHDGEGLHRSVDPEDGRAYVYAMTFLDASPRVFASFDQPDLKAEVGLRVHAPSDWTVIGNGRASQDADSTGWWTLAETKPLSTYFVTLVAGPYHSVTSEHDGITLGLHCRQSLAAHLDKDSDDLFTLTGQCFDEYHRLFGIRYPFGDYHQAFVPEFNAGAMENPGCVTFMDGLVFKAQATASEHGMRANTVAHEMAHQWFGDLVTMQWWDDLWLNESFADYMGHRVCVDATSYTDNWLLFALHNKAWGLDADQRSSTHPVAGNGSPDAHSALTNFDGISYSKGAVVLRQLNNYLGDTAFLAGIVDHLTKHSFGNATLAHLIGSWEQASGKDLSDWTHSWLRTSGVDTLSVEQGSPTVIVRRNGSSEDVSRIHAVKVTSYDENGGTATLPVVLTEETTEIDLDSRSPGTVVLVDSEDETWAKIGLDDDAIAGLALLLPRIDNPVSRAVIWGSLRDGLLEARIAPDTYLDIACAALPQEPNDLIVDRWLTQSGNFAGRYLHSAEQLARLEKLALELLAAAEPGSNRQLLVSRALLRLSTDVDLLWSWLDGHAPEGLLIDEDARWRVLERLCVLGAAGADDIARESVADPSSQGAVAALRCSASLPSVDNKAAVWKRITTDADLSNHDLYALCQAFFRSSQHDLVRPYVARYFTEMPATTAVRIGWVVELSCMLGYPSAFASRDVVEMAERALADESIDPFAKRALSDGTDDLRRLLASREAFA